MYERQFGKPKNEFLEGDVLIPEISLRIELLDWFRGGEIVARTRPCESKDV